MNLFYFRVASGVWLVWVVSWWVAALWIGRQTAAAERSTYRWPLMAVFVGFILLFGAYRWSPHSLWTASVWLGRLSVALVVIGAGVAWWARLQLGTLWSGGVVTREGHRIVDTGPYALVRHPIYTGLILGAIGLAMVQANALALAGTALIALGFARKAQIEERFLSAELGEEAYSDYRSRVPMLVPFAPARGAR